MNPEGYRTLRAGVINTDGLVHPFHYSNYQMKVAIFFYLWKKKGYFSSGYNSEMKRKTGSPKIKITAKLKNNEAS